VSAPSGRVTVVEVGPRDGLQNEPGVVPVEAKVAFVEALADAGLTVVEATAFVSPKAIPQLADGDEVFRRILKRPGVRYPVLVPNERGMDRAEAAGVREIAVFTAASETFNLRNVNASIEESFARFAPVIARAKKGGMRVRGYVSCAFGCPYEGAVRPEAVAEVSARLAAAGCDEVSLGDTIGVGTAGRTQALFAAVAQMVPVSTLAGHFHDTYGQALANVYAAMELGVATFDCSVAGLGGCPYAKGATGNVASEDVVYLLDGMGIATGVDLTKLRKAGQFISDHLDRPSGSRVARALAARDAANVAPT